MIVGSIGVNVSWMLLKVRFSQSYLIFETISEENDLIFPQRSTRSTMSCLYFVFDLGTMLATMDVEIVSNRGGESWWSIRFCRAFYIALVVLVAFQILHARVLSFDST